MSGRSMGSTANGPRTRRRAISRRPRRADRGRRPALGTFGAAAAVAALLALSPGGSLAPAHAQDAAATPPADSDAAALGAPSPSAGRPDEEASARERVAEAANGPHLEVRLEPGPHTVGDRVEAVLTLRVPAGAGEPVFPSWGGNWGEVEVMDVGPVERVAEEPGDAAPPAGEAVVYRQRVELAAFRPGAVPLPPVQVILPPAAAATDQPPAVLATPADLALSIESVLPAAAAAPNGEPGAPGTDSGGEGDSAALPDPMPPAPPRPLPLGEPFLWALAIGLALCLAAIFWAIRRARAARSTAGAAAVPPFEELRAAVDAARAEGSPDAGHTRLSLALRRYLGRALGFPAAESTTSEIRRRLAARRLPGDLPRRAVALLSACDLVKFARRPATAADLTAHADAALGLATDLEVHLHPPEPAEPAAGSGSATPGREAA